MIRKSDGKIGVIEIGSLGFILVSIKIADTTMYSFIQRGDSGAWLLNLIAGLIALISVVFLLLVVKKNPGKTFLEILKIYFGRVLGIIIYFSFLLTIFYATIYHARIGLSGISIFLLPQTPDIVVYTIGFLTVMFIALRGLETVGRVSWAFAPIYLLTFIFIIIFAITSDTTLAWQYNFPMLGHGLKDMAYDSVVMSSHYGEFILLFVLLPYVRSYKEFKMGTLIVTIYSIIATSIFLFLLISIFGYPTIDHVALPFHDLVRVFNIGKYLYNMESFFLYIWATAETIRFAVYLYLVSYMLSQLINVNEHEPLIIPITFLIYTLGLLISGIQMALEARKILLNYAWVLFAVIPFILWIISLWVDRRSQNVNTR